MASSDSRAEQSEAEIRRRISLHLENVQSPWQDDGSYEELEELLGRR